MWLQRERNGVCTVDAAVHTTCSTTQDQTTFKWRGSTASDSVACGKCQACIVDCNLINDSYSLVFFEEKKLCWLLYAPRLSFLRFSKTASPLDSDHASVTVQKHGWWSVFPHHKEQHLARYLTLITNRYHVPVLMFTFGLSGWFIYSSSWVGMHRIPVVVIRMHLWTEIWLEPDFRITINISASVSHESLNVNFLYILKSYYFILCNF